MDAAFDAGPAMSRTNAAPGERPLSISATAIGIDPVAQRYIGMANASTKAMLSNVLSWNVAKNVSGTNTVMSPATTNPMTSHLPMSCIMSKKAYFSTPQRFLPHPRPIISLNSSFGVLLSVLTVVSDFPSEANRFTISPPNKAVQRAATGRSMANGNPMSE